MRPIYWLALAIASVLAFAPPAQAAVTPSPDFVAGQTLGLGYMGASYDYAWRSFDAGVALTTNVSPFASAYSASHLVADVRGLGRFIDTPDFQGAVIAGVELDPGATGQRAYLVPDVGLSASYRSNLFALPVVLRLAVTLTVDQGQGNTQAYASVPAGGVYDPNVQVVPSSFAGNLLQRIVMGPNTSFGVGLELSDRLELTLGSGTVLGARYRF